jgi:hypothetical protein
MLYNLYWLRVGRILRSSLPKLVVAGGGCSTVASEAAGASVVLGGASSLGRLKSRHDLIVS